MKDGYKYEGNKESEKMKLKSKKTKKIAISNRKNDFDSIFFFPILFLFKHNCFLIATSF